MLNIVSNIKWNICKSSNHIEMFIEFIALFNFYSFFATFIHKWFSCCHTTKEYKYHMKYDSASTSSLYRIQFLFVILPHYCVKRKYHNKKNWFDEIYSDWLSIIYLLVSFWREKSNKIGEFNTIIFQITSAKTRELQNIVLYFSK